MRDHVKNHYRKKRASYGLFHFRKRPSGPLYASLFNLKYDSAISQIAFLHFRSIFALYGLLPRLLILKLVYCLRLRLGDKSSEGQLVIALRTSRTASPFLVLASLLSNLHMVDSHFLTVFEICNSLKDLANDFLPPYSSFAERELKLTEGDAGALETHYKIRRRLDTNRLETRGCDAL